MPTEEIFTSPDARRAEGTIRSTMPLVLSRPADPRPRAHASRTAGSSTSRPRPARTSSARRSRPSRTPTGSASSRSSRASRASARPETLFYNTLFDENATCHIAYGAGLEYCFDGEPDESMNQSQHPRRLHGRRPGARGRRAARGRDGRPAHPRRGLAAPVVTTVELASLAELEPALARERFDVARVFVSLRRLRADRAGAVPAAAGRLHPRPAAQGGGHVRDR